MQRLADPPYLAFPFRIDKGVPATSDRGRHVREQIEQVLFTSPRERVFRPDFGSGVRTLVFQPNNEALEELTRKRLFASLAQALHGEVDPKSLRVDVTNEGERLLIVVAYTLASIGLSEHHRFILSP